MESLQQEPFPQDTLRPKSPLFLLMPFGIDRGHGLGVT